MTSFRLVVYASLARYFAEAQGLAGYISSVVVGAADGY
jgi:hypothetical protein